MCVSHKASPFFFFVFFFYKKHWHRKSSGSTDVAARTDHGGGFEQSRARNNASLGGNQGSSFYLLELPWILASRGRSREKRKGSLPSRSKEEEETKKMKKKKKKNSLSSRGRVDRGRFVNEGRGWKITYTVYSVRRGEGDRLAMCVCRLSFPPYLKPPSVRRPICASRRASAKSRKSLQRDFLLGEWKKRLA